MLNLDFYHYIIEQVKKEQEKKEQEKKEQEEKMKKNGHIIRELDEKGKYAVCDLEGKVLAEYNNDDIYREKSNFFYIVKGYASEAYAYFYSVKGKFIGRASVWKRISSDDNIIIRYVECEKMLALGEMFGDKYDDCEWSFYTYEGEPVSKNKYLQTFISDSTDPTDYNNVEWLFTSNNKEDPTQSEVIAISTEGKILFRLEKFKEVYTADVFIGGYFFAKSIYNQVWTFDWTGREIFDHCFNEEQIDINTSDLIFEKMDDVPWYTIYDCEHQTKEVFKADKIERLELGNTLVQYYKVCKDGKNSIWEYNVNTGFRKKIDLI